MDFEDLFENNHKQHRHNKNYEHGHHYEQNDHYSKYRSHHSGYDLKRMFIEKIKNNPKTKLLFAIAAIAIIVAIVLIAILLFPLIIKLIRFASENGIQGIIDVIWKGTK